MHKMMVGCRRPVGSPLDLNHLPEDFTRDGKQVYEDTSTSGNTNYFSSSPSPLSCLFPFFSIPQYIPSLSHFCIQKKCKIKIKQHEHVQQKVWNSTPIGCRYQLGGFLTVRIFLLVSSLRGTRYGLFASFRKKNLPPQPCLVRNTGIVLYLYLYNN